jgi:hypothetical protein
MKVYVVYLNYFGGPIIAAWRRMVMNQDFGRYGALHISTTRAALLIFQRACQKSPEKMYLGKCHRHASKNQET